MHAMLHVSNMQITRRRFNALTLSSLQHQPFHQAGSPLLPTFRVVILALSQEIVHPLGFWHLQLLAQQPPTFVST